MLHSLNEANNNDSSGDNNTNEVLVIKTAEDNYNEYQGNKPKIL